MFCCRRDSSSSSSSSSDSSSESSSESSSDSSRSRSRGREKKAGRKAEKEKRKESKEAPAEKEKVRERSGSKRARSRSGGRKKSSSPPPSKIHIGRLTRNVNKEHLTEIFSTFGKIKDIEFGSERMRPWLNKGNQSVPSLSSFIVLTALLPQGLPISSTRPLRTPRRLCVTWTAARLTGRR